MYICIEILKLSVNATVAEHVDMSVRVGLFSTKRLVYTELAFLYRQNSAAVHICTLM